MQQTGRCTRQLQALPPRKATQARIRHNSSQTRITRFWLTVTLDRYPGPVFPEYTAQHATDFAERCLALHRFDKQRHQRFVSSRGLLDPCENLADFGVVARAAQFGQPLDLT